MHTPSADRLARFEQTAQDLLAEGFTTKAGQKEATTCASRAYAEAHSLVMRVFLDIPHDSRTEAQEAVYFGIPDSPHQWRAKHAELIRRDLPTAAQHIPALERLVALYQAIKAAPVNLAPRNPDGSKVRIPHRSEAYNPQLREQFMAQAPALAKMYADGIRARYVLTVEEFATQGVIPEVLFPKARRLTGAQAAAQALVDGLIRTHSLLVEAPVKGYVLDEVELARRAQIYGKETALRWFYKTNLKLGQLTCATLHRDANGEVLVSGLKDGCKVVLHQQPVTKWAPVRCEFFHQFPARLYLDGVFTPEAEYAKRFPDAEVAPA